MRIAILTSHPIQYYGPLFRTLAARADVEVFFAHRASPKEQARAGFGEAFDWDVDLTSGYTHTFLKNTSRRPGTDHFSGCDTPDIGRRLRAGRFDVLLLMGWNLKCYFQALFAAKRIGLPVMVRGDSHLGSPRSGLKQALKPLIYPPFLRLFDAALYVGSRSRDYYRHYHYPEERLFHSPHAIDTDWFGAHATEEARADMRRELGVAPEATLALFAGRLLPYKRPTELLEAIALCRVEGLGCEMLVAGDGELRKTIAERARARSVPLHFLGFCNQTRMPKVYAACDMLVLPSDGRETWGLVANEALACGRQIIVSEACGCAPDLASDGLVGHTFPVGDAHALAREIASAIAHPAPVAAIRERSNRHSLHAAVDGILAASEWLTRSRHAILPP